MEEETNPIMHSMHKDTAEISKDVAGSSVTEEEAILITSIKEGSVKRRTRNFLGIFSFILIIISIGMFFAPDLFLNKLKTKENLNQEKNKTTNNFFKNDNSYKINLPNTENIDLYKQKSLNVTTGINEIIIFDQAGLVSFENLSPLLNQRFIDGIKPVNVSSYMYGAIKEKDKTDLFLILKVSDQDIVEKDLLSLERTMYSDFENILKLKNDTSLETKEFSAFNSIRLPVRELINGNNETVIVYGFPVEKLLLITINKESYNALSAKILSGF